MRTLLLTTVFILLSLCVFAQEYSYTHYDLSDGLAGSTVYCTAQDRDGFMWFGTETGVSRFDGTHFHNYSTSDGLPDVEIIQMFGDSKNRLWMAPFRKSICYYYKGKIHNPDNDSVLRKMHFRNYVENFAEDSKGNILIQEGRSLLVLDTTGHVTEIDTAEGKPFDRCHACTKSIDGNFLVQIDLKVYELIRGKLYLKAKLHGDSKARSFIDLNYIAVSRRAVVYRSGMGKACILDLKTGKESPIVFNGYRYQHVNYGIVSDSIVCANESIGSCQYTTHGKLVRHFLPGVEITRTFMDDEGNNWFTTMGQGIYRLNSDEFRTIRIDQPKYPGCAALSIVRSGNGLLVGTNRNGLFRYELPSLTRCSMKVVSQEEVRRIFFVAPVPGGNVLYGTGSNVELHDAAGVLLNSIFQNVKKAVMKNDHEMIFASSNGCFLLNIPQWRITDTLWHERTTTVYYKDGITYIGTLNGLYALGKDGDTTFLGKTIPFLRKRIAAIVQTQDGLLWIASYDDAGIIAIRNGRVVASLTKKDGLASDICRVLAQQGDCLWVGTDRGLNRVDLKRPGYPITQYTANDGLGSNAINTIYVDNPMVYVGTPAGLSYFDETKVNTSSGCRFYWLDISSSGKSRMADTNLLFLPYRNNDIHFEYVGISYRSVGNILYKYRLLGLDTAWKTTHETFLDYPALPSGSYELQVIAVNKFGTESVPRSLHFEVATPFWRTGWFYAALVAAFLLSVWFTTAIWMRTIRRRQREERQLSRRVAEMEHMALRAQMNPHFIFNCLNSIQQYIFDQDVLAANKYITGFSRLIRETLQNSSRSYITIGDEVRYLSSYLALEKLRFKQKMDYSIGFDPDIRLNRPVIPPMIIQPYVENSMRHGLRHKPDGKGVIRIVFAQEGETLTVTVEDNGIGREKAASYKTREHIEYQSRGMQLTAERIGLINELKGRGGIEVEVIDLKDPNGVAEGTRVIIRFILNSLPTQNEMYDQDRIN